MIDLVPHKVIKKGGKKKSKLLDIKISDSLAKPGKNPDDISKPVVKKGKLDPSFQPQSTVLEGCMHEETFMMPSDIEFVATDKALDEVTIPSDLDDPDNSEPLSNLIARRSTQGLPEAGLAHVWTHKRKLMRKNKTMCRCYSVLEGETLSQLKTNCKSKRKFLQCFIEFEAKASLIQCEYPDCKRTEPQPSSKHSLTNKLVSKSVQCKAKKSKRVAGAVKSKETVAGVKRARVEETDRKVRYSKYFINEVVRLMCTHKTVFSLDLLTKLVKTKQLKSCVMKEASLLLIKKRDHVTYKLLITHVKSCSEQNIIDIISYILKDPVYAVSSEVDGQDKTELDLTLVLTLSLPFESGMMKRVMKEISTEQAIVLLTFISDKLLNNTAVTGSTVTINQVVHWCNMLVELHFSSLVHQALLVRKMYNSINQHLHSSRCLLGLNEHLFRIKHRRSI